MGAYLNPGKESFRMAVRSQIFVDKTEMILFLNSVVGTKQRYVSVSRPRRSGKTTAADMVCAYYGRGADSRELFEKRKLSACEPVQVGDEELPWDAYLGKFDVIRVVMTDFMEGSESVAEILQYMTDEVTEELMDAYPDIELFNDQDLIQVIDDIYSDCGRQIVLVIDEWDAIFRERMDDKEGQGEYLGFLRDLMKDNDHIALAYMTGILPIKKVGQHSSLNMFDEYSMMAPMQLAPYTGFTEEEVEALCSKYGRDFQKIKDWYDGYAVSGIIPPESEHQILHETGGYPIAKRYTLYSPLSVVNAVRTGQIRNYWNKTETYEALAKYIRKDYDGLKDAVALLMDGGRLKIDTSTYENDMTTFTCRDDVLSLLLEVVR